MHGNIHLILAANAARKRQREEEEMLGYTSEDLNEDWEFKIVRAGSAIFRKPEILQQLLEEEALAGWIMLEKLDDARVRFKRRRKASAMDLNLPAGVDPYRTIFHHPQSTRTTLIAILISLSIPILIFLIVMMILQ